MISLMVPAMAIAEEMVSVSGLSARSGAAVVSVAGVSASRGVSFL
jgi:hypothetical protein